VSVQEGEVWLAEEASCLSIELEHDHQGGDDMF
jgi:hypothetical protein